MEKRNFRYTVFAAAVMAFMLFFAAPAYAEKCDDSLLFDTFKYKEIFYQEYGARGAVITGINDIDDDDDIDDDLGEGINFGESLIIPETVYDEAGNKRSVVGIDMYDAGLVLDIYVPETVEFILHAPEELRLFYGTGVYSGRIRGIAGMADVLFFIDLCRASAADEPEYYYAADCTRHCIYDHLVPAEAVQGRKPAPGYHCKRNDNRTLYRNSDLCAKQYQLCAQEYAIQFFFRVRNLYDQDACRSRRNGHPVRLSYDAAGDAGQARGGEFAECS